MTNKQMLNTLRLLERTLSQTSPLSLRVLGISETDARYMACMRLVSLGVDNSKADSLDKLSIIEILDAGIILLARNPERTPLLAKIGRVASVGVWDLLKIVVGVLLGWYLGKHFG